MSTPPPPPEQQPTRRLQPTAAAPPPLGYEPAVPVATDAGLLYARQEDSISSLRTALIFVGIIAVLAAGVAVYALTRVDSAPARTTGGVSSARVTRLEDRVDRLSRQVQQARASARGVDALSQRVDDLAKSVATLRSEPGATAPSADTTKAITDLGTRVDDLEQKVASLGQGQTTP
jgi:outer membrane murein-binding lipoprotein Lpp